MTKASGRTGGETCQLDVRVEHVASVVARAPGDAFAGARGCQTLDRQGTNARRSRAGERRETGVARHRHASRAARRVERTGHARA